MPVLFRKTVREFNQLCDAGGKPGGYLLAPRPLHRPFHFAAGFAGLDGFPAVMLFLAFGQPEFDLGEAPLGEIDAERDERESLLLCLPEEFIDFLAVEEQFPRTKRLMIHDVSVAIGIDVTVVKKHFTISHAGITILQVHAPIPQRFDFRTLKHDTCLELVFNKIIMVGLAICDHRFLEAVLLFPHQASDFHIKIRYVSRFQPDTRDDFRPTEAPRRDLP